MQITLWKELEHVGVKPGEKVTAWVEGTSIHIATPNIYSQLQADNDLL
jgi:hypothetical protein